MIKTWYRYYIYLTLLQVDASIHHWFLQECLWCWTRLVGSVQAQDVLHLALRRCTLDENYERWGWTKSPEKRLTIIRGQYSWVNEHPQIAHPLLCRLKGKRSGYILSPISLTWFVKYFGQTYDCLHKTFTENWDSKCHLLELSLPI